MSLWKVAWRSIQQRSLASALTAFSMALGVALVVAVLVVYQVVSISFHRGGEGYDLIVGAKGSKEQLVLNTVYYLQQPVENVPYSYYEEFTEGRFAPDVDVAIPVCMGHTYQGFRVVGTVPEMFESLTYLGGQSYEFAAGRNFSADAPFEAVIGAAVARETNLRVAPDADHPLDSKFASTFQAVHGVAEEGGKAHQEAFTVVGVLAPTGTPNDRALFVNMEGFYHIHEHDQAQGLPAKETSAAKKAEKADHAAADHDPAGHDSADHDHDADHEHEKQVTAILVCVKEKPPGRAEVMAKQINQDKVAQAVAPSRVIADLFEGIIGKLEWLLLFMAVLIVVVAGIGIMVSIYTSMSERRHEIAIMRALGARRVTVMLIILMESILLSLSGGLLGLLLGHGMIGLLSSTIVEQTGVTVGLFQFRPGELILIPGLVALASLVGYLPAVAAYRTDVARSLTANQ
jgi:putative ABC transport system permease protein